MSGFPESLPAQLYLLAYDPRRERLTARTQLGYLMRAAALTDLRLGGHIADQEDIVRGYYQAKLVVMNIGDGFSTGPAEAAYVINDLVKPNAVIASHANEAGTENGKVRAGSKTETFMKLVKAPVHVYVPFSGKTMEFDANGRCTKGC